NDQRVDIAFAIYQNNTVSYLTNSGQMSFALSSSTFTTGIAPYSIAAADLDNDGSPDLTTANIEGDNISILLNRQVKLEAPQFNCAGCVFILSASGAASSYSWNHTPKQAGTMTVQLSSTTVFLVRANIG